ncbi:MAG TPA: tRNA (adenosine(37)-N6)-threonylcarbamoyltransferase complex transferase subunit TsaD, partial [Ktedonobacterales bacterium]|nr:tRNA (adenosine(37)-N6)-threonylcarbamoyltransferase complex transferase subunit TsaD [Ktedonobacterales bacterium]
MIEIEQSSMRILGIESSCDETGAAVVEDGRVILSTVVASQASIHERYGGVVPEVASRQQLSAIIPVLETALEQSGTGWEHIDGIAATYGPGLAGSLLVGLTAGKTLSLARRVPFIGVNHLEAHIYANWLQRDDEPVPPPDTERDGQRPGDPAFPLLALVISGAHTELVHIPHHGRYELLGQTRDDAAGEAFDKVARVLGLGYPGGPAIERAASQRDAARPNPYKLPRAWLADSYDFSFSGLKTAVVQMVEGAAGAAPAEGASRYAREGQDAAATGGIVVPDVADAFQDAVVDVLAAKTVRAAQRLGVKQVVLAGGVAANLALRARLARELNALGIVLRYPPVAFCTDNAAMIASAGYFHLRLGERSGF